MNKHYDNYLDLNLETQISDYQEGYYYFADTVFYGEKGGQESDQGTINGYEVLDLKWDGDRLGHRVDAELTDPIQMAVDPKTRAINTAVQTTFHLLDGYYEDLGIKVTAVHANPDHQWYEIDQESVSLDDLRAVEDFVNRVIREEVPVTFTYQSAADYPDPFYQQFDRLRLVHIGDYNSQPCGTPHVNHTGQIHSFAILGLEKGKKGTTRIRIAVEGVVAQALEESYQILSDLGEQLDTGSNDLVAKTAELVANKKAQKKTIKALTKELQAYQAQEILAQGQVVSDFPVNSDQQSQSGTDIGGLAQILGQKAQSNLALVTASQEGFQFAIISPQGQARHYFDILKSRVDNVSGGGSPKLVTGRVNMASRQELKNILAEIIS